MTKQAIPSEADKIKEALYERSNGTLIVTDDDVKKFQECQAAGFSFESAVGLFFQVKMVMQEESPSYQQMRLIELIAEARRKKIEYLLAPIELNDAKVCEAAGYIRIDSNVAELTDKGIAYIIDLNT